MFLSNWDLLLIIVVTGMAVITAYIENPQKKTFILMLPIPFSIAVLSLGIPIDATNVIALLVLNLYYHIVRILHYRIGLNIVSSIIIGAASYCVIGAGLAQIIPETSSAFWISCALVLCINLIIFRLLPNRDEPGNITSLSIFIKAPLTAAIVFVIILIKSYLLGFMTFFPMVGVFATYESRKSLWTTCKSIPVISITMTVMLIIIKISEISQSTNTSLLIGWVGLLVLLIPYFRIKTIQIGRIK